MSANDHYSISLIFECDAGEAFFLHGALTEAARQHDFTPISGGVARISPKDVPTQETNGSSAGTHGLFYELIPPEHQEHVKEFEKRARKFLAEAKDRWSRATG
jgi:hypothetical protein